MGKVTVLLSFTHENMQAVVNRNFEFLPYIFYFKAIFKKCICITTVKVIVNHSEMNQTVTYLCIDDVQIYAYICRAVFGQRRHVVSYKRGDAYNASD